MEVNDKEFAEWFEHKYGACPTEEVSAAEWRGDRCVALAAARRFSQPAGEVDWDAVWRDLGRIDTTNYHEPIQRLASLHTKPAANARSMDGSKALELAWWKAIGELRVKARAIIEKHGLQGPYAATGKIPDPEDHGRTLAMWEAADEMVVALQNALAASLESKPPSEVSERERAREIAYCVFGNRHEIPLDSTFVEMVLAGMRAAREGKKP